jgi:hypothetical protein
MTSLVDRPPEALWQRVQPLLPAPPPRPRGGVRRRVPDRNCVAALVFMARTSTLSSKRVLLDELGTAGRIDLERVRVDSFSLRAVKGGS